VIFKLRICFSQYLFETCILFQDFLSSSFVFSIAGEKTTLWNSDLRLYDAKSKPPIAI
jgi:hypothetical protein